MMVWEQASAMERSAVHVRINHLSSFQAGARSIVPGLALLGLACLLLLGCANPGGTAGSTAQQTSTAPTTHPSITPTPALTQQYDFTAQDNGRTVTYVVTSRFEIFLNQQQYPKENLQVSCAPSGTIGNVSNLPAVTPPMYVVRYEGVQPGMCTIKNGTFLLSVRILDSGI